MKKLAIITTHPIQYNAPMFALLSERREIQVRVFYTWGEDVLKDKFDPGFGKVIKWDIPLLEGYDYSFLKNISNRPGSHHFKGIDTPSLIKEVKEWDAEAVLVYGWSFRSHLKALRYFKGKLPVLFRGDSTLLNETPGYSLKKIVRRLFLNWVYKHVDIALFAGSANKAYYERFGLRKNQLIFAPHAIDNYRFEVKEECRLRAEIGISDDDILFLFAGKFENVKNPLFLVKTFLELNIPDAHLLMVGNGPLEDSLKKMAENSHGSNVHFINFQNQSAMPCIYQSSDVFILPSISETWGLSANEAMAAGMALLISSQCGCASDLVKEGKNGFIFKSDDKLDLKKKIQELTKDRVVLKEMGKQSQELIKEWSFEKIAEAIESAIKINDK